MELFTSQYEHTIDAKGRMFIPSKYRGMLGTSLILGKGTDGNLYIMTVEGWDDYKSKVMELVSVTEDKDILRVLFGSVTETQIDSQGRILIPAVYMEHAGLSDGAVIVGCGPRAEIWSPDRWKAKESQIDIAAMEKKLAAYRL